MDTTCSLGGQSKKPLVLYVSDKCCFTMTTLLIFIVTSHVFALIIVYNIFVHQIELTHRQYDESNTQFVQVDWASLRSMDTTGYHSNESVLPKNFPPNPEQQYPPPPPRKILQLELNNTGGNAQQANKFDSTNSINKNGTAQLVVATGAVEVQEINISPVKADHEWQPEEDWEENNFIVEKKKKPVVKPAVTSTAKTTSKVATTPTKPTTTASTAAKKPITTTRKISTNIPTTTTQTTTKTSTKSPAKTTKTTTKSIPTTTAPSKTTRKATPKTSKTTSKTTTKPSPTTATRITTKSTKKSPTITTTKASPPNPKLEVVKKPATDISAGTEALKYKQVTSPPSDALSMKKKVDKISKTLNQNDSVHKEILKNSVPIQKGHNNDTLGAKKVEKSGKINKTPAKDKS